MLSKNELKFLRSLQQKKYRRECQMFIVEGRKLVTEVLQSDFVVKGVYATTAWIRKNQDSFSYPLIEISNADAERVSALQTSPELFALVEMKENKQFELLSKCLLLEDIKDAGNLGTLIRTANWFGIQTIVCSEETVELYNPKTIQATMGAFTQVQLFYTDLKEYLKKIASDYIVYGTFLKGKPIQEIDFAPKSAILIGNESHGISSELAAYVDERIYIPTKAKYPIDSLNVAVANAIVCYELTKK